VIEEELIKFWK